MVRDHEACLASALALACDEVVATVYQTTNQSAQRARRCIGGERASDVMAVERETVLVHRHVLWAAHLPPGVAAPVETRARSKPPDPQIRRGPPRRRHSPPST